MADQNEKDIQDLINKYTQQQNAFAPNPAFAGNVSQGINPHKGIDNQGMVNESTPLMPGSVSMKGPDPVPVGNSCQQCDMMHPPLRPGEKCPNAMAKAMKEGSNDPTLDINKYLTTLQTIMISQVSKKKIKDIKKFYQNITIEMTKFLEDYTE